MATIPGTSIEVEDTGIGISPEQAKRIFDRFSQTDAATTRKFGGTGLGLTISTALAELMGGGISLRSAPNQGSCFRVEIRTAPAEGTTARTTYSEALWSGTFAGVTILLAEDNRTNRLLIRKYLNGQNVELIEAENGHEAVHLCRNLSPDLILMDMSMPELDGIEATRRIRALEIAQPVIIALTANAFFQRRASLPQRRDE